MNFHPYCPWCRGPLQRSRSKPRRWSCAPCVALYAQAQQDGVPPPWGDNPWQRENPVTYGGTLSAGYVEEQLEAFNDERKMRRFHREGMRTKRLEGQVRVLLERGIEPVLQHFARTNKTWNPSLFYETTARTRNVDALEALMLQHPGTIDAGVEGFFSPHDWIEKWDVPVTWEQQRDYYLNLLSHHFADRHVFNDGDGGNRVDDDFAERKRNGHFGFDGRIGWVYRLYQAINPGATDDAIREIFHAFLRAGAILDYNDVCTHQHHAYDEHDAFYEHVRDVLSDLAMGVLDERIAAGYDLHLLLGRSYKIDGAVRKLLDAGLSFADLGPGAFEMLIRCHADLAVDVLNAGLPRHVFDPTDGQAFMRAVKAMLEAWSNSKSGHAELSAWWRARYDDLMTIVNAMLGMGVNVNGEEHSSWHGLETPAILALDNEHEEFFHVLRKHGAKLEPCVERIGSELASRSLHSEDKQDRLQRQLAMLLGIQHDELSAAVEESGFDVAEPVVRAAGRRRL